MFEKLKEMFKSENNSKKKVENLSVFLIILVITLIVIKYILNDNNELTENTNLNTTATLANNNESESNYDLEEKLEKILSQIEGVGNVSVLVTYSETSSTIAMYNEKNTTSITEESDKSGGIRKITSEDFSKEIIEDKDSNPITQKTILPKIEGSVIIAQGASNPTVKANIISAVEAATGLAIHKIQVFEMKK